MNSEEIAQFRGYLASQSMKRTPIQLYDALEEAYRQLLETVDQFPETAFHQPHREGVWSIAEIVEHVMLFMARYEQAICMVLEQGLHPPDVSDRSENRLRQEPVNRVELLTALQSSIQHLAYTIQQAEPDSHLDVTWKHFELGVMHWREWLLLARVHLLDHVRQLQTMRVNYVE
ncbi:MAG TPA: DinB family protein [Ktedonobacteraceae bacterium]|nr:DinB family protein [Ktedonobacteraceae bacterium]